MQPPAHPQSLTTIILLSLCTLSHAGKASRRRTPPLGNQPMQRPANLRPTSSPAHTVEANPSPYPKVYHNEKLPSGAPFPPLPPHTIRSLTHSNGWTHSEISMGVGRDHTPHTPLSPLATAPVGSGIHLSDSEHAHVPVDAGKHVSASIRSPARLAAPPKIVQHSDKRTDVYIGDPKVEHRAHHALRAGEVADRMMAAAEDKRTVVHFDPRQHNVKYRVEHLTPMHAQHVFEVEKADRSPSPPAGVRRSESVGDLVRRLRGSRGSLGSLGSVEEDSSPRSLMRERLGSHASAEFSGHAHMPGSDSE